MQDQKADSKVPEDKTHQQVISEELALIIHKIGCEVILGTFYENLQFTTQARNVAFLIPIYLATLTQHACWQLSCNYSGVGDVKTITLAVFNILVKYSWDAKVVLVLSAFAVCFGEFCLLSQLHATNPLAKSVILLKPLPDISERESLIHSLLKVVIDVTKCIISLTSLPSQYISRDQTPLSEAVTSIPNAVYCAVKSIVACASESIGLINIDHE